MKGLVLEGSKKLGHTDPPIRASAATPKEGFTRERRKRITPFWTGQTGSRANFSICWVTCWAWSGRDCWWGGGWIRKGEQQLARSRSRLDFSIV